MAENEWIWVRIHRRIAAAVASMMRGVSEKLHESARSTQSEEKRERLVQEADDYHHVGKQIQREYGIWPGMKDYSVRDNSAPVAQASPHYHEGNTKLVPWLMFISIICGVSLATSIYLMNAYARIDRDFKVLFVIVQDQDALLIRHGVKEPGDITFGPTGNLEYNPHKHEERK